MSPLPEVIGFKPGQIVIKNGFRYLVNGWKPGWIHLDYARKDGKKDRRYTGFSGSDFGYEPEVHKKDDKDMDDVNNAKAPKWYTIEEIRASVHSGSFFRKGGTIEESIALHLQAALEKGFEMGRRNDPTSENVRLRNALKERVMVWNDPSDRDYRLCNLCGLTEGVGHTASCVLA